MVRTAPTTAAAARLRLWRAVPLAADLPRPLSPGWMYATRVAASPDGRTVYAASGSTVYHIDVGFAHGNGGGGNGDGETPADFSAIADDYMVPASQSPASAGVILRPSVSPVVSLSLCRTELQSVAAEGCRLAAVDTYGTALVALYDDRAGGRAREERQLPVAPAMPQGGARALREAATVRGGGAPSSPPMRGGGNDRGDDRASRGGSPRLTYALHPPTPSSLGWTGVALHPRSLATTAVTRSAARDVNVYDGDVPVTSVHCVGSPAGVGWWTPVPGEPPATIDDVRVATTASDLPAAHQVDGGDGDTDGDDGDTGDGGDTGSSINTDSGLGSGALLATVEGPEVALYDLRAGVAAVARRRPGPGALHALDTGSGGLLAVAGTDRTVAVYDGRTMSVRGRWRGGLKYGIAGLALCGGVSGGDGVGSGDGGVGSGASVGGRGGGDGVGGVDALSGLPSDGLCYVIGVDNEVACGAWSDEAAAAMAAASSGTAPQTMMSGALARSPRRAFGFRADSRVIGAAVVRGRGRGAGAGGSPRADGVNVSLTAVSDVGSVYVLGGVGNG
ncbi:hypothetical protein MMPV_004200 [Pyropia vietnamensis]